MSEIVKGSPTQTSRNGTMSRQFDSLVEVAAQEPGGWFSMPIPDGITANTASTLARNAVSRKFASISISKGRVWVNITL